MLDDATRTLNSQKQALALLRKTQSGLLRCLLLKDQKGPRRVGPQNGSRRWWWLRSRCSLDDAVNASITHLLFTLVGHLLFTQSHFDGFFQNAAGVFVELCVGDVIGDGRFLGSGTVIHRIGRTFHGFRRLIGYYDLVGRRRDFTSFQLVQQRLSVAHGTSHFLFQVNLNVSRIVHLCDQMGGFGGGRSVTQIHSSSNVVHTDDSHVDGETAPAVVLHQLQSVVTNTNLFSGRSSTTVDGFFLHFSLQQICQHSFTARRFDTSGIIRFHLLILKSVSIDHNYRIDEKIPLDRFRSL